MEIYNKFLKTENNKIKSSEFRMLSYYVIAAARNSVGVALSVPVKFTTDKDDNCGNGGNFYGTGAGLC